MKTYIALDLETTGFDATKDQVIEIAAIKFQNDKIIESFQTLVNPQVPIPAMVSHITGIHEEDLKGAPLFHEVQNKFLQFLGNDPIVGHNISFDINFLRSKGLNLQNSLYDTLILAGILLPGLPSYSLDTIGRTLKITHEQKHRAMSDTKACYELFLYLLKKIALIDPNIQGILTNLLFKTSWQLKELFCSENVKPPIPLENILEHHLIIETPTNLSKASIESELKQHIEKSLAQGEKILIEAAAETNIPSAILDAAYNWSTQSNDRGIIALEKHAIQKISVLPKNMTLIDSRENYLSITRLKNFMEKKNLTDHEITLFIKIMLWLQQTKTGNLKELSLQGKEYTSVDEICCHQYLCTHDQKLCFFQKALTAMKNAKIVLIPQHYFFHDQLSPDPLLSPSDYIIMDHVDQLEKTFTETLSAQLTFQGLHRPFEKIKNLLEEDDHSKKLPNQANVNTNTQKIITRIEILFGLIGIFIEKNSEPFQFCFYLNDTAWLSGNNDWHKIEETSQNICESGNEIIELLHKSENRELQQAANEAQKVIRLIPQIIFPQTLKETLRFIAKNQDESMYIKTMPTHIGPIFRNKIIEKQKKCLLVSESITVKHSFSFIREQLQLDQNFKEIILKSHNNSKNITVHIIEDLPPPATEGYFLASSNLIKKIAIKKRGKTVVLFSSKKAITATYHAIAPALKDEGITVLAQYVTGGKGKILEYYKDEAATSILFATNSFWEKMEFMNGEVDYLIIQKLPFDPPDDPHLVSKRQYYKDLFNDFQIPHAILKFKHQIGKLACTVEEKGNVVLLDNRIKQKLYGKDFLESLPDSTIINYVKKDLIT